MKKLYLLLGVLVLSFVGCNKNNESTLLGKWSFAGDYYLDNGKWLQNKGEDENAIYEFKDGGELNCYYGGFLIIRTTYSYDSKKNELVFFNMPSTIIKLTAYEMEIVGKPELGDKVKTRLRRVN